MSNGLAIAGVTAVLQHNLHQLYNSNSPPFTNTVTVSTLAPDLVQQSFQGNAAGPENQVNLFLHQVTHNAAWRNVDLPSLGADGATRLTSPPLALDLHYLLTVYATDPWQAEALLGYALMLLHENPVLARGEISTALNGLDPTNLLTPSVALCGLADQVEMIKITPETMGREEMAWLWTALKADYRPTYSFQASVVLMQPQQQTTLALPVLGRRVKVLPIQPAQILQVSPPGHQLAAAPTDMVTVAGEFLSGVTQVVLSNPRFGVQLTPPAANVTSTSFTFVPNHTLAGVYDVAAQFIDATGTFVQTTNTLPIALAPVLPTQTATVVNNAAGRQVTVTFTPPVLEGQSVSLSLSSITPPPPGTVPFTSTAPALLPFPASPTTSLSFEFPATLPSGQLLGRLQVDGVTSQVAAAGHPPAFTGPMVTI